MQIITRIFQLFFPHPSNNHKANLLRPVPLTSLFLLFLLVNQLFHATQFYPKVLGYATNISADAVIKFTNQKRSELGLPQLNLDYQLSTAARNKAADMFSKNYWAHVSPDGIPPWSFISKSSYRYSVAGENLARDFDDSYSVVDAWMNSPSHKDNLLNPKYKDIGVAVVNGKLNGHDTTLVVQMFGTKLNISQASVKSLSLPLAAPAQALESDPGPNLPTPSPVPSFPSPQTVSQNSSSNAISTTRGLALLFLSFIGALLIIDILFVYRKKIVRLSSDSIAHLSFIITLITAILIIKSGVII